MTRLYSLFVRPIVRIVFLTTLLVVAVTLIILGNMARWTAHSTAQPIAARQAAAIVQNGEDRSLEVQLAHSDLMKSCASWWTSSSRPPGSKPWAPAFPRACCSSDRQAQARR